MNFPRSKKLQLLFGLLILISAGWLVPEPKMIPVARATSADWHPDTFWYEPWGTSGVHKGVDIFAARDTEVIASTHQIILYRGEWTKGGKVILALGPKWRLHYYAHLSEFSPSAGLFITAGSPIGKVGDTGNAAGKAPHLHYSILSLIPMPWLIDTDTQGIKKSVYLNPIDYFG